MKSVNILKTNKVMIYLVKILKEIAAKRVLEQYFQFLTCSNHNHNILTYERTGYHNLEEHNYVVHQLLLITWNKIIVR